MSTTSYNQTPDLLESSKALLDLDERNALVPHGLGGHGHSCLKWCIEEIERLRALRQPASDTPDPRPFQERVEPWMQACFGPEISADRLERGDRLLEEVFELLQSGDYPRDRVRALEKYVWSRATGDPAQEVGGVMVTLAAYCLAHDLDMHVAAEAELARIWGKVASIRAKQAGKPTGSALPVAVPHTPDPRDEVIRELGDAIDRLLACPAIADENHSDPEWGDKETADAILFARRARAALSKREELGSGRPAVIYSQALTDVRQAIQRLIDEARQPPEHSFHAMAAGIDRRRILESAIAVVDQLHKPAGEPEKDAAE